jgi:parallel beta-helix repeat protein
MLNSFQHVCPAILSSEAVEGWPDGVGERGETVEMRSRISVYMAAVAALCSLIAFGIAPAAADVCNLGFEDGVVSPWVSFNYSGSTSVGIDSAARTGSSCVRLTQNTSGNKGGVYLRFPVTAGQKYSISAYCLSGSANNAARMRVDAAGGTDYSVYTAQASQGVIAAYTLLDCGTVTATSSYITVFLAQESTAGTTRYAFYDDIAVVPAAPTSASVNPASVDVGGSATFTATGLYGTRVAWYSDSSCASYVGAGSPFVLTNIAGNTTLYARNEVTCGSTPTGYSSTASATVQVACEQPAIPTNPAASPSTITAGQSSTLTASVDSGCTVDWFTGSCGGTLVGSGTSLVVSPTVNTTYYPRARNLSTGCTSASCGTAVTITITTASIRYVKYHAGGTHDGLSWATSFDTVQEAVSASSSGNEVWVAAGTYVGNVVLKSGVAIYGGFAGTETSRSQRNWTTNISILDGDCGGSVIEVERNATTSTRIDGLTLTNGRAVTGGGVYCNQGASPVICNNTIKNSLAEFDGGGIHVNLGSTAVIANNKIINNAATAYGGGIRCTTGTVKMTNNFLIGNTARYGGAIACGDTSTTATASTEYIVNNTIVANTSNWGGGIYCCTASSAVISSNIIAYNSKGIYVASGPGSPVLRANCLYSNAGGNYSGISQGGTDILTDPQLASAAYGSVHIQNTSPCKNAGNNSDVIAGWTDIDGQTRVVGTVDIGADESDGTTYTAGPTIIRVSTTGSDSNNGSTWALAKRTIQAAIDAAGAASIGDAPAGEVWVKAGTYSERIVLKDFVYVYGGFAGTETARTQRNVASNLTIIDAASGGSAVTATSLGYRTSAVDGFKIQNGKSLHGAGVFCRNASPQIMNNTITAGSASGNGGGIYLANSNALVRVNQITNNSAKLNGGGIFCFQSFAEISRCNIENDTACIDGCGVYSGRNDSCDLINNKIIRNQRGTSIGQVWGAAVGVESYSDLTMNCNTVADNGSATGSIYCGVFGYAAMFSNIVSFNTSAIVKGVNGTLAQTATFTADPLFVNRAGGDYRLTSSSGCINAADEATAPADDYLGYSRNDPDIGCYEFGAGGDENPVAPTSASATPSTVCAGSASTLVAAGGSGTTLRWMIGSCGGTTVGTGNNLVVYPIATTTYYARWETNLGNSTCVSTTVTVSGTAPTASVGGSQAIEAGGTTVPLGGNTPTPPATGEWSVVSGGTGTFSSANDPNATFTHVSGDGPIVLRWTVSSPPCTPATAEVVIIIGQNCVANGGFDSAFTGGVAEGWSLVEPAIGTWAQETTIKHSGIASQKITDASGSPSYTTWFYQTVSVKPNRVYVPVMWIYRLNSAVARVGIDPNGGVSFSASDMLTTSNTWVRRVNDAFTSGSTGQVSIALAAGYQTNSGTIYYDDVTLEPQAPQTSGGAATIYVGQSATLTAGGGFGGDDSEMLWYTGPGGTGALAGAGKTLIVFPTSTTTYYPRWETSGGCGISADGSPVTITVQGQLPAPTLTAITPWSGPNTGATSITDLAGTNFQSGATVRLRRTGQSDIAAAGVSVVSATKITCSLNLTGKTTGLWDVVVTNPDSQSAVLANAFGVIIPITAPVLGTNINSLLDQTALTASASRQFCIWGKVETIDSKTFWLNDGSGTRIRIFAPGYTGLTTGDFASAIGTVDLSVSPPVMVTTPARVRKY